LGFRFTSINNLKKKLSEYGWLCCFSSTEQNRNKKKMAAAASVSGDYIKLIEAWTEANFRDLLVATSLSPLNFFVLALTVLIIAPTILLYFLVRRKDKRNGILLLGLSGSGKTSLYYLVGDSYILSRNYVV